MTDKAIKNASTKTLVKALRRFIVRNSVTETKIINELVNRNIKPEEVW